MSFLVCPICGKSSSLNRFDPSAFDLDVYAQSVTGLGKGKGFAVTGRHSILHSSTTTMIKDRMLDLLLLLHNEGVLRKSEIIKKLKIKQIDEEYYAHKALVEEKNRKMNRLSEELGAARALIDEKNRRIRNLSDQLLESNAYLDDESGEVEENNRVTQEQAADILNEIESELGEDFRTYEDDPVGELRTTIKRLMDDYRASLALREEYR